MSSAAGGPSGELAQLWAGWRGSYIDDLTATEQHHDPRFGAADRHCPFCRILGGGLPDDDTLIVWRGTTVFCVLNAYPYTAGHVLVLPYAHAGRLDQLDPATSAELWWAANQATAAVERAYACEGVNIGANLGRAAGAGIPGHVHFHVLPRWFGDTNFMTTITATRVIPEALAVTYTKLRAAWPTDGDGLS